MSRRKNICHKLRKNGWKFIHWSYVIQGGEIISTGVNKDCNIEDIIPFVKDGRKLHAEQDAWIKAKRHLTLAMPWYMVNIRLNKKGNTRNSAPCKRCQWLLSMLGATKAIFTIDGGWATWRPSDKNTM